MTSIAPARRGLARAATGSDTLHRVAGTVVDATGLERSTFRNHQMELFVWTGFKIIKAFELHDQINTSEEWSMLWVDQAGMSFHCVDTSLAMHRIDPYECPLRNLHEEFVMASPLIDESIRRVVLISLSHAIRRYGNES